MQDLQKQVMFAARDNGISSVLFRNAIGRKLGLSITESECLSFLTIQGLASPTEVSRYISLTSGATTTLLDRLEKAGFIERKPNPNDRRGSLIAVSKLYMDTAGPVVAGVQKAHIELLGSYSAEELKTIVDFLTRFTNNVTQQTQIIEKDLQ